MRLGWDHDCLNAPELARRAEAAGVRMITVHGRTRCQFYTGAADWAAIRAVKDAISIPLVANGDLRRVDASRPRCWRLRRRRGDDRARRLRPSVVPRPGRGLRRDRRCVRRRRAAACLHDLVLAHYAAILAHYGDARRPPRRAQAPRLVSRGRRRRGRTARGDPHRRRRRRRRARSSRPRSAPTATEVAA